MHSFSATQFPLKKKNEKQNKNLFSSMISSDSPRCSTFVLFLKSFASVIYSGPKILEGSILYPTGESLSWVLQDGFRDNANYFAACVYLIGNVYNLKHRGQILQICRELTTNLQASCHHKLHQKLFINSNLTPCFSLLQS